MKNEFLIGAKDLTLEDIERILSDETLHFVLSEEGKQRIQKCRDYLDDKVARSDRPLYGITTGFGSLCDRSISPEDLTTLQNNLVKSHACSCGNEVNPAIVRLMLLFKAHALSIGNSGVQVCTVECIIEMLNKGVTPVVYDKGSLGASGDLAPLANLFLPLIGEGEVRYKGEKQCAKKVFEELGIKHVSLKSKEGLALLNGTQFMSSHGAYALVKAHKLIATADYVGALSLEAFDGLCAPFFKGLHELRPHKGQQAIAAHMRGILDRDMAEEKKKQVQDPYSFRCIPQVHGASWDAIQYVTSVVMTEINSVTDNPTIFPDDDVIVSGGNFHGQPLAIVYDFLAIALAELGNISERRVAQLILGLHELPEFLVTNPGLNSGFMIPQYAAAALVSRNKMYCYSAASDSIVSSNGQEDHVSMGANAATKLLPLIENLEMIFAIELMNASQALDLRQMKHNDYKVSDKLTNLMKSFREVMPMVKDDVVMYTQMQNATEFVRTYDFGKVEPAK